jgi:hypothetical protein
MTRETEKLKLVTDFRSLRQGDLVVVKCDHRDCGRAHRGMLLEFVTDFAGRTPTGESVDVAAWSLPVTHRSPSGILGEFGVSALTVARRIVFLVDVGLSREAETHEAKPVTKPRELARGTR